jgi:putative YhbY family RNA-binding protein
MIPLSPKKRSELRAEAHKLSPIVIIGDKGLTDEVVAEIDRSLKAHELIKVRAATDERDARDVWLETICEKLEAHPVQQIGKVFVIYRENPKEKKPKEAEKPRRKLDPRLRGDDKKTGLGSRLRGNDKKRGDDKKTGLGSRLRGKDNKRGDDKKPTGTSRRGSPPPSPRPASEPRRRRPRTSR